MNYTNKDYFTFNVHNSALIVGQSGSGKTALAKELMKQYQAAHTPETLKFVLFDLKMCEFRLPGRDYDPEYLYCDVITNPEIGLTQLEKLSTESMSVSGGTSPLIFIYIDECDMAALDQTRFDAAVTTINRNAISLNMKLIYATSSPRPSVVSKALLHSFDLVLAGNLQEGDYEYLEIPSPNTITPPYEFQVVEWQPSVS